MPARYNCGPPALGSSTVLLNGGVLDLRADNSTVFNNSVTLAASSTINVDAIPGDSLVSNQAHTIGGLSFGAAGATRTLTVSTGNIASTPADGYGLNTGPVMLNDNASLVNNSSGMITISSITSGAANAATLSFSGVNNSTVGFAGNIVVSGPVTQGAGALTLANTGGRTLMLNGALSNTGGVAVTGGGTVQFGSGASLAGSVPFTVTNGTLDTNGVSATVGGITMGGANGGTIQTEAGVLTLGGDVTFNTGAGTATINGNLNLGSTAHNFNIAAGSAAAQMTVNAAITDSGGGFNKNGAGTLELTGNNSSTGQVTVNGGTLDVLAHAASPLGSGTLDIAGGTLRLDNLTGSANANSSTGMLLIGTGTVGSSQLLLNGNGASTTLTLAGFGGRSAGSTGALVVIPNDGALNSTDVISLTNAPTPSNGILPAYIVAQNSGSDSTLDFLSLNGHNLEPGAWREFISATVSAAGRHRSRISTPARTSAQARIRSMHCASPIRQSMEQAAR